MQAASTSTSRQVGLSAVEFPKDHDLDAPARTATVEPTASASVRSQTIESGPNVNERSRKLSIATRVKNALKNRENVKLFACYYALATAGEVLCSRHVARER